MDTQFDRLFSLISDKRLRESKSERAAENDIVIASESDKSRVINAAAFRRLQQKAQVFSLETNASVRTRLTHSIEVSQIGRYLAQEIIRLIPNSDEVSYRHKIAFSNIIETACLLHDIGNPPFGHLGEAAIRKWFNDKNNGDNVYAELAEFDGNAQGFRLITYLSGGDEYGLNLTASTILSFVKYPFVNQKKGLFNADFRFSYSKACKLLGWHIGKKFPLAILMDLADEISYCMSDLEDGLEKGVISKDDLYREFNDIGYPEPQEDDVYPYPFIQFKTKLIHQCVQEAAKKFVDSLGDILDGKEVSIFIESPSSKNKPRINKKSDGIQINIFKDSSPKSKLDRIKKFARKNIYSDRNVELIELAGAKIITGLLNSYEPILKLSQEEFVFLVEERNPTYKKEGDKQDFDFQLRLINTIPISYINKYKKSIEFYNEHKDDSDPREESVRAQLIVDFISGMTDDFALEMYQFLEGIKIHA